MKRTPPWVWVAAAAVQIAALGICVWAMERHLYVEDGTPERLEEPPQREALAPPQPRFGPAPAEPRPVSSAAVPAFIAEAADADTQVVAGRAGERPVVFGFYADGNVRTVDTDAARYAGKAESARARMREVGGTRAFTVQIGVAPDGRLQAVFTGGLHDGETIALDPLVGGTVV